MEPNKPRRIRRGEPGYGRKKFVVLARNADGEERIIRYGDPASEIRRDNEQARRNFRSRHNCDDATDILTARYWSCRQWRESARVED